MHKPTDPPALATFLLSFFASDPDFPEIAGDLREEFDDRRRECGVFAARRWYLRETWRNFCVLSIREILRAPIQPIAVAVCCGLLLTVPPFLALFEAHHPPYLIDWRTFNWLSVTYQTLTPVLMGLLASRILPGREWALALIFVAIYTLAGMPRLLGDSFFEAILPEALSWLWLWTITTFGAACVVMRQPPAGKQASTSPPVPGLTP